MDSLPNAEDAQCAELSDEYLRKLQADIDSRLEPGVKFTSVSRAHLHDSDGGTRV